MPIPKQYCFLCASDEGVFLDITEENRAAISQQLETCSLHPEHSGSSDECFKQICHKCAYELRQCSSFVDKFKRTLHTKKKFKISNRVCCLCLGSGNKLQLFDLEKDNYSVETPIYKIKNFFNHDIYENKNRLICLSCRYILDVLYDLNKIYRDNLPRLQNIKNEELNYSLFSKTITRVVNRKTTTTESNSIREIRESSFGSESSIMPRKKESKTNVRNRKSLLRSDSQSCAECKNTYSSSTDVYRIHKTGHTVCKKCWLKIGRSSHGNIKASAETKVCSVFVKDVLRDSTYKKDHVYKIEEDSDGNKTYIITEPQNKEKTQSSQRKRKSNDSEIHVVTTEPQNKEKAHTPQHKTKRAISLDESSKPRKRSKVYATRRAKTSAESTDSDEKPTKKQLKLPKNGNISKVSNDEPVPTRRTRNQAKIEKIANVRYSTRKQTNLNKSGKESVRKAASDTEQVTNQRRSGRNRKRTIASKTDISEDSSNEGVSAKKRKKLIPPKTETNGQDVLDKTSAGDSSSSDIEIISVTDVSDETNDAELKSEEHLPEAAADDEVPKSRREKRTQVSEPPVVTANEKSKSKTISKKDIKSKRARSKSASSNEVPQTSEGRKKQRENTPPSQLPVTLDVTESSNGEEAVISEENKPHICKICEKSFETKLLGLTHELSHHKQLEVKLHRRKLEEESEVKEDVDDKEATAELEETSENIAIRLDDDEDTDIDVISKPEKENTEHSDEVKEDAPPKENALSEALNDVEVEENSSQHETSSQKADKVQSSSVETDKDKTPEDLDDSLKKNLDSDVAKDNSDKSNSHATEEKDSNEEAELQKESMDKSDNCAEKDQQVDSPETDKLTQIDVEPSETDAVDKDASIMEASDDVPAETENGDISTEKVKEDEVEPKELKSSMDILTKNTKNSDSNAEEQDKCVPEKATEIAIDETPDIVQEAVKENSVKEVEILEEKDSCETTNVTATENTALQDLEGSKTEETETDTQANQSEKAATEVLQEVFDLAAAEVQKRQDSSPNSETENQEDVETVENISREIQNSVDFKPLDTNKNNEAVGIEITLG